MVKVKLNEDLTIKLIFSEQVYKNLASRTEEKNLAFSPLRNLDYIVFFKAQIPSFKLIIVYLTLKKSVSVMIYFHILCLIFTDIGQQ